MKRGLPSVAIIIPVKSFNRRLEKSLRACLELDYPEYEIIVFPDETFEEFRGKIKTVPTGPVGPAQKRDLALAHSRAEIFAFIDDDAYPEPRWLKKAVRHFENEEIAAVGGPAVTPRESPPAERAGGHIYASAYVSGPYGYRYVPQKQRFVDDYPSCNFIIRREVFERLGGFNSRFYPGEDTKLCLEITHKLGRKIIYDPEVLVQHHRRELWKPHLRQAANYGLHRGYFVKHYPKTSLKIAYFLPALFFLYLTAGALASGFYPPLRVFYAVPLMIYFLLMLAGAAKTAAGDPGVKPAEKGKLLFMVFAGIILTHLTYGLFFIKGLTALRLSEHKK